MTWYYQESFAPSESLDRVMEGVRERSEGILTDQPAWQDLASRLLAHGGGLIILRPEDDLSDLIRRGEIMELPSLMERWAANRCHENVARMYTQRKTARRPDLQIAVGWCLSEGRWFQHTWGVCEGHIIETTFPFEKYFGFILDETMAEVFVHRNG